MLCVRPQTLGGYIDAHPYTTHCKVTVYMDLGPTPCIGTQVHAGERILHGNFADKINQTARRRNTRLQTGNALEHLHTLLVFPSRRNEVAAGQTIAQEIVVLVQEKTTHRQAFNIARGVVAVGQRGIQLDGVG